MVALPLTIYRSGAHWFRWISARSAASARRGDGSHRASDSEPFCSGAESGPESAASRRLHGRIPLDGQRGNFGAFVGEVLLGGGKLFLTGAAFFEAMNSGLRSVWGTLITAGGSGTSEVRGAIAIESGCGKRGNAAGKRLTRSAGLVAAFSSCEILARLLPSNASRCTSRLLA